MLEREKVVSTSKNWQAGIEGNCYRGTSTGAIDVSGSATRGLKGRLDFQREEVI